MNATRVRRIWTAAQACSVGAALSIVALLFTRPQIGLLLAWDVLVPLVPVLLLIAPGLWRNLCPVAVVHQIPARLGCGGTRRLSTGMRRVAPAVAAGLFFMVVPLRHAVFNESGTALALFIVLVLLIAFTGALIFSGKSGWCATFCPVLPVERLYGQQPVVDVEHAHCAACTGCIRSCYDLKPERSMEELLDAEGLLSNASARDRTPLLGTPMGAFAASFPGFVLAYFTVDPNADPAYLYLWTAGLAVGSSALLSGIQAFTRASSRVVARGSGALAAALYYWFSVPAIASAAHEFLEIAPAPGWAITTVRVAFVVIAALWLLDAPRRERVRDPMRVIRSSGRKAR